jgi:hypothetical protein
MVPMKGWSLSFCVAGVLATAVGPAAQTLNPQPREVIRVSRSLLEAETAAVMAAARAAVDGRTFRVSYQPGGPGVDFQMGPDGRPRYLRMTTGEQGHSDTVTFLHYTRMEARGCDGTPRSGELVREYENKDAGWTVKARTRSVAEVNDRAFDMLAGHQPITAGPVQTLDGRTVRPFVAPYQLPAGALGGPPPGSSMALWLDTDMLLPVRWSLKLPVSPERGTPTGLPDFAVVFTYLDGADLAPPSEVVAPDCIP